MARPMRSISACFAPTTDAIRATGTRLQFRQTNACSRSGKCGVETGDGAEPDGRSWMIDMCTICAIASRKIIIVKGPYVGRQESQGENARPLASLLASYHAPL